MVEGEWLATLVRTFRRGIVDETIETLFQREYVRLVQALTFASGSEELAAEAVQDAFVQADRHWSRICRYEDPARWLRRVAVNRVADARRSDRRAHRKLERLRAVGDVARTAIEPAVDDTGDARVDLRRAIDALPERQRLVVALHHLADLPVDEVAAVLQISPGTVKSQLHDARRNLFQLLEVPDGR